MMAFSLPSPRLGAFVRRPSPIAAAAAGRDGCAAAAASDGLAHGRRSLPAAPVPGLVELSFGSLRPGDRRTLTLMRPRLVGRGRPSRLDPPPVIAGATRPRSGRLSLPAVLFTVASLIGSPLALPPVAMAGPLPYPEAVAQGRQAARAVLSGDGAESCLRGKITAALLQLSQSCAAAGQVQAGPLCALADRAVVVTPMDLPFMEATARQLLELSVPGF